MKKISILHIARESPFIEYISKVYELAAPQKNIFVITGRKGEGLHAINDFRIVYPQKGLFGLFDVIKYARRSKLIIIHGMDPYGIFALLFSKSKTIKIWSGWGYDYYGNACNPDAGLISKETKLINNTRSRKHYILGFSKSIFIWILKQVTVRMVNYFSAPIPTDYEVFKENFKKFKGEYIQVNYGEVSNEMMGGDLGRSIKSQNILVGNSASPTNNHIDVFKILKKIELQDRKIIVPLSYGDHDYRLKISQIGSEYFGDSFIPLIDFIPMDKYASLVSGCNIVIMNHWRQQGLGNICMALYQGANVYLNKINPCYKFFIDKGIYLKSIDELNFSEIPIGFLDEKTINSNREILKKIWGNEVILSNVKKIVDLTMG